MGVFNFLESIEKCITVGQEYSVSFKLQWFSLKQQCNISKLLVVCHVIIEAESCWKSFHHISDFWSIHASKTELRFFKQLYFLLFLSFTANVCVRSFVHLLATFLLFWPWIIDKGWVLSMSWILGLNRHFNKQTNIIKVCKLWRSVFND